MSYGARRRSAARASTPPWRSGSAAFERPLLRPREGARGGAAAARCRRTPPPPPRAPPCWPSTRSRSHRPRRLAAAAADELRAVEGRARRQQPAAEVPRCRAREHVERAEERRGERGVDGRLRDEQRAGARGVRDVGLRHVGGGEGDGGEQLRQPWRARAAAPRQADDAAEDALARRARAVARRPSGGSSGVVASAPSAAAAAAAADARRRRRRRRRGGRGSRRWRRSSRRRRRRGAAAAARTRGGCTRACCPPPRGPGCTCVDHARSSGARSSASASGAARHPSSRRTGARKRSVFACASDVSLPPSADARTIARRASRRREREEPAEAARVALVRDEAQRRLPIAKRLDRARAATR